MHPLLIVNIIIVFNSPLYILANGMFCVPGPMYGPPRGPPGGGPMGRGPPGPRGMGPSSGPPGDYIYQGKRERLTSGVAEFFHVFFLPY